MVTSAMKLKVCCSTSSLKESDLTELLNTCVCVCVCVCVCYASLVPQRVKKPPAVQELQEAGFDPWVSKSPWRRE